MKKGSEVEEVDFTCVVQIKNRDNLHTFEICRNPKSSTFQFFTELEKLFFLKAPLFTESEKLFFLSTPLNSPNLFFRQVKTQTKGG